VAISAIIFDADGVVIFPWRFARYLEQEFNITPEMTRGFFRGVFEDCLVGNEDLEKVLPPFLSSWGWPQSVDDFITVWLEVENAVDGRVVEVIRALRRSGFTCCLATSQEQHRAEYMRCEMGFSEIFDRLFFSHRLGYQKPEDDFYRLIEESLGLEGPEMFFWDDAVVNVRAARERGWNAELYAGFESFQGKLAEYLE
jgi:putative hydrolase of the HAD superfamily